LREPFPGAYEPQAARQRGLGPRRPRMDIGRPSRAVPVTPPCVRVRTRRFDQVKRAPSQRRGSPRASKKARGKACDIAIVRLARQGPDMAQMVPAAREWVTPKLRRRTYRLRPRCHCFHTKLRSRRATQPSSDFNSSHWLKQKYARQPRRYEDKSRITAARLRPRVRRVLARTVRLNRSMALGATRRRARRVKVKPRNFRSHGPATALLA